MAPRAKKAVVIDSSENQVDLEAAIATSTQQMAAHTNEIMNTFGDGLIYERSRLVSEARFFMAQSADAMLEAGKRLIVLKENEPHGDFVSIVEEQLGLAARTARQMMQAAFKYCSPQLGSKRQALAVLGKTKLFELMAEDDDQLAELADGGTIAGLTLDKIDTMSTRELKSALRESKADIDAKNQVIASKNKKIDDQSEQIHRIKKITPDEVAAQLRKEANAFADDVEALIRTQLAEAFSEVQTQSNQVGIDQNDYLAARLDLLDKAILHVRGLVGIERTLPLTNTVEWEEPAK